MSLLQDAYQKRDRVAMVSFRKQEAIVESASNVFYLSSRGAVEGMPVGGKTPLAAGLRKGQGVCGMCSSKIPRAGRS